MQLNDVSLLMCNEKTFPISKSKSQSSSEQERMEVTVVDLLDHPNYLHLICEWIFNEWPEDCALVGFPTLENLIESYRDMEEGEVLIALKNEIPIGTISLIENDFPGGSKTEVSFFFTKYAEMFSEQQ